jgi:hypothetical protein
MHTFHNLAGAKYDGCISLSVEDRKYRTAIDIAKATIPDTILPDKPTRCGNTRIVLFRQENDKLKILNPSDIITEPTDFVVVNINDKTLGLCAKEGLIDIAKWLLAYGHEWHNTVISNAAYNNRIEFAKWAYSIGCPWGDRVISNAVYYNHIEFAKWARENGCPWNKFVIVYAVHNNNIEFAKWARENGCPWDDGVMFIASRFNRIEFVKWALLNGCPRDNNIIKYTAYNGHIEFAKWAISNGFPLERSAIKMAAYDGHIEFAKWARENGCPWSNKVIFTAILSCRMGSIICPQITGQSSANSAELGHCHEMDSAFFCRAMGPRAAEILTGKQEFAKWAHTNGCPWGTCTISFIRKKGYTEFAEYARDHGCPL